MEVAAVFLLGLASGMVSAISTGGGLISVPGLILLGTSPVTAIATTRLSALSSGLTSSYRYYKKHKIIWRYTPYLIVVSLAAGLIGPKLLFKIDEQALEPLIGFTLLLLVPTLLHDKKLGLVRRHKSRSKKLHGLIVLFIIMIYGTMIGAGGGIFLIYALMYFFGTNVTQATATGTIMWLAGTLVALVAYISQGAVDFSIGIPLLISAAIGGSIGAKIALNKGTAWVKAVLIFVIIAASIKLLLF
jgi:uncharacterized membrane protein YfcA